MKCLLLTYIVFVFLFFVILVVGGVLAYIFREQVVNTIQAEMIADIRNYDPEDAEAAVTRAWDLTQTKLGCCGLMTEKVEESWQMWRFNKNLNPASTEAAGVVVPWSCCVTGEVCVTADNVTVVSAVWPGDCMQLSLGYVQDKARMLGAAAFAMSCFTVTNLSPHSWIVGTKLEHFQHFAAKPSAQRWGKRMDLVLKISIFIVFHPGPGSIDIFAAPI